jgi:sucrose-6-phosphate hydrolase SacC (GH32 family)
MGAFDRMRRSAYTRRAPVTFPPSAVLVEDGFIDADGTALEAHSIKPTNKKSSAWVSYSGSMVITGNYALPASTSNAAYKVAVGTADVEISVDLVPLGTPTSLCGIRARMNGTTYLDIGYTAGTKFAIYQKTSEVTSQAMALTNGQAYRLKVTLKADSITASLNGVSLTCTNATNQTVANHGIRSASSAQAKFKNFKITKL